MCSANVGVIANNQAFSSTYLGKIASLYYLNHKTVGMVRERLFDIDDIDFEVALTASRAPAGGNGGGDRGRGKGDRGENAPHVRARLHLWRLLMVLCDAPEFAELPVRHCEDELNEQLARELTALHGDSASDAHSLLGFFAQHSEFGSAHGKAFLLLLAHLEGASLPISDYINDTKMVQDQVTRVLKAMVDIAAEEGLFDIVLRLCYLSQLLVQGVTSTVSELCQLPSVDSAVAAALVSRGVSSVRQLQQMGHEKVRKLAADCLLLSSGAGGGSVSASDGGRGGRGGRGQRGPKGGNAGGSGGGSGSDYENSVKVSEFLRVVRDLPDVEVKAVRVRAVDSESGTLGVEFALIAGGDATTAASPLPLSNGATYEAEVVVRLRNRGSDAFGAGDNSPRSNSGGNNTRPRGGGNNVFTKKPHKPKPASWYLVAGLVDAPSNAASTSTSAAAGTALRNVFHTEVRRGGSIETRGELIALKSVSLGGSVGEEVTLSITFTAPDAEDANGAAGNKAKVLSLVLACDAILGVDVAVAVPVSLA